MIRIELEFYQNTTEATTYPNPLLFRNLEEYPPQPSTAQISTEILNSS